MVFFLSICRILLLSVILAGTETWALTDNDNLPIPGYSSISKACKDKTGGGVAFYLQNKINLKYKVRVDLSLLTVLNPYLFS